LIVPTTILAALLVTYITATVGARLGVTDKPDSRKLHQSPVPLTGGIAICFIVFWGTLAFDVPSYFPRLAVGWLVFCVGVFDDYRHIDPRLRLVVHYGCGLLLAGWGGVEIHNVGNLLALGDIPLGILAIPLTALAVAGLCNAYNMIDGIDGLAAATMALPLAVLYMLAQSAGDPRADNLLLALIPLAVFLVFNLGPNTRLLPKVFLGDGGSVTLGYIVTVWLVFFSQQNDALIMPVTALWLVTLPLMDMLATLLIRARQGRKLMQSDRSHLHHTLIDMGFSSRQTLLLLVSYATLCALIGLALEGIPEYLSLACYFLVFLGHCVFVIRAEAIGRRMGRPLRKYKASGEVYCDLN